MPGLPRRLHAFAVGERGGRHGCGTFVALNDVLYGPPGSGSIMPTVKTEYTTVSQTTSGSGTTASPHTIVTVVRAGSRAT